eukprot:scaffold17261_cov106-Isochrysis_galbana.AAC.4
MHTCAQPRRQRAVSAQATQPGNARRAVSSAAQSWHPDCTERGKRRTAGLLASERNQSRHAPLVYDLLVLVLQEVALLLLPCQYHSADLAHGACPLLGGHSRVPLGQPHLALPTNQQNKVNPHFPSDRLCASTAPPCASARAAAGQRALC